MGTGFDIDQTSDEPGEKTGIIPRSLHYLFDEIDRLRQEAIEQKKPPSEFTVEAQFVELYNEEVFDLINAGSKVGRKETHGDGIIYGLCCFYMDWCQAWVGGARVMQ